MYHRILHTTDNCDWVLYADFEREELRELEKNGTPSWLHAGSPDGDDYGFHWTDGYGKGPRAAFNGIIYQMRTGCPWNQLPEKSGDDSSVHRTMQRWIRKGVFQRMWATLVQNCEELGGLNWQWQSADGAMGKARFGGTRSARTPRIAANRARNAA